jgi:carbon storage regulator CsrA
VLVLSRKKSEQIQIGENITITVLRVKGSAVQIGVDAPSNVKILRSELSFDPPAAPVQAPVQAAVQASVQTATNRATTSAAKMELTATAVAEAPAAKRTATAPSSALSTNRIAQFREEMRLLDTRLPMPSPLTNNVTLADTLVFLG